MLKVMSLGTRNLLLTFVLFAQLSAVETLAQLAVPPRLNFNACEKPEYTAAAARAEVIGSVWVMYTMETDGRISEAFIDKSSGPTPEHKQLDRATLEAVKACKGSPGLLNGQPQRLSGKVDYVWKIVGGNPIDKVVADRLWSQFRQQFSAAGRVGAEITHFRGRYYGEVRGGVASGLGIVRAEDQIIIGRFSGEHFDGLAVTVSSNGVTFIGEFTGGVKLGTGVELAPNGQVSRSGRWTSGAFSAPRPGEVTVQFSPVPAGRDAFIEKLLVGEARLARAQDGVTQVSETGSEIRTPAREGASVSVTNSPTPQLQPSLELCPSDRKVRWDNCYAEIVWRDGEVNVGYAGEWRNNRQTGRGAYSWRDGRKFVGVFKDSLPDGEGIEYRPDGSVNRSGSWEKGQLKIAYTLDTSRFPFNQTFSSVRPQPNVAASERERILFAEVEAERKRRQDLEREVALEKERQTARPTDMRPSTSALGRGERRVALVIGNSAYKVNPLTNPVNDAVDLDSALRGLGFKTTLVRDATIAQMRSATRQFSEEAASSDVAMIFFAGHGIESKGRNYLIPVSADIKYDYELEDQAYDASRWLEMLESVKGDNRNRVNIVVIDACRNNDLARSWRSSTRGLARMDAPTGTFLAFATAPGKVAMDGSKGQRNSPFTRNLLRAIQTPDLPIELMFKEVRRLVIKETSNEQVPWDNSSLVGDFVFRRTK